jgi:hypothetical protein
LFVRNCSTRQLAPSEKLPYITTAPAVRRVLRQCISREREMARRPTSNTITDSSMAVSIASFHLFASRPVLVACRACIGGIFCFISFCVPEDSWLPVSVRVRRPTERPTVSISIRTNVCPRTTVYRVCLSSDWYCLRSALVRRPDQPCELVWVHGRYLYLDLY